VVADAGVAEAPPAPVDVVSEAAAPDPTPAPTVRFRAPVKGQIVPVAKAGDFEIKLEVSHWNTAPDDKHVHVILDNRPYVAIYDTGKPIKLSRLLQGEKLSEGHHVLVAFPSRATHESVKTDGAFAIAEFFVGKKGPPSVDTAKPMLIYSRPKGPYEGDKASRILIDFYLSRVALAPGKERVRITVKGPGIDSEKVVTAERFGPPFYLVNPQDGTYTVRAELVGSDGKPIAGTWNDTSRTITVLKEGTAPAHH
jgi:hypothetical protein